MNLIETEAFLYSAVCFADPETAGKFWISRGVWHRPYLEPSRVRWKMAERWYSFSGTPNKRKAYMDCTESLKILYCNRWTSE